MDEGKLAVVPMALRRPFAIGTKRGLPGDIGEIRRIVNSFLQMIEQDRSHSLIISATNCADIVDQAFLRRFDDVLAYGMPSPSQIATLLRRRLQDIAAPSSMDDGVLS